MLKLKSIIFFAVSLSFISLVSFADSTPPQLRTYQYWARIPQTSLSCQEEANQLAARFTAATGFAVSEKICRGVVDATYDGVKTPLYSLLISYQAPNQPYMYKAMFGFMDFQREPTSTEGAYATYNDCAADLSAQSANYERETSLKAMAAYCMPSDMGTSYLLEVEGFGSPTHRLYVMNSAFDGTLTREIHNALDSFIAGLNAHVVAHADTHYFYYRDTSLELRQNMFGSFSNPAECAAQLDAISSLYTKAGSKQKIVACLQYGNDMALNGLADGEMLFSFHVNAVYYSFDECMQDRARAIQANTSYREPYGAVCTQDYHRNGGPQYVMDLYQ